MGWWVMRLPCGDKRITQQQIMQGRTSWCQDIIAGLCLVTALLMGGVSEKDVSGLLTVFVIVGQGVCECVCVGGGGGGWRAMELSATGNHVTNMAIRFALQLGCVNTTCT
jgi:hypothetical protein